MKRARLLAETTCLNKLVNGKVVIINMKEKTYVTLNPGMYTPKMPETFNPEDYAILETEFCPVIIEATPKMKEHYLVNKYWKEQATGLQKYAELKKGYSI